MNLTNKKNRRSVHKLAMKMHFKGLVIGSIVFVIPQILLWIFGMFNLSGFIFNSLLFVFLQGLVYWFAYKMAIVIVKHDLE